MTNFASLLRRKDRPLPPRGCSYAFYIGLLLLTAGIIAAYLFYLNSPQQ